LRFELIKEKERVVLLRNESKALSMSRDKEIVGEMVDWSTDKSPSLSHKTWCYFGGSMNQGNWHFQECII